MTEPNNACIFTLGTYRAVYDIKEVDAAQKIWKGKPLPIPIDEGKGKPSLMKAPARSWLFFSRVYHKDNEWDRFYPEIEIDECTIAGVPFLLVPKEKQLFGYEPPTDGIVLPRQISGVN